LILETSSDLPAQAHSTQTVRSSRVSGSTSSSNEHLRLYFHHLHSTSSCASCLNAFHSLLSNGQPHTPLTMVLAIPPRIPLTSSTHNHFTLLNTTLPTTVRTNHLPTPTSFLTDALQERWRLTSIRHNETNLHQSFFRDGEG
jgi:hypothetical protein